MPAKSAQSQPSVKSPATRVLVTLGPASNSPAMIKRLAEAGTNAFRLNFSHGSQADHQKTYQHIRSVEKEIGRPLAILADMQGPKLRISTMAEGVVLEVGQEFTFDDKDAIGDKTRVHLPHPEIFATIAPGNRMLVNDGNLRFSVVGVDKGRIVTKVDVGGAISDRKGVNVPDIALNISPLTEKDLADLEFALGLGVDWVALSFVQRVSDVLDARKLIKDRAALMVKIEKPQALTVLDDLIYACDGIMVARGDLGVEMPPEQVPGVQKDITMACRRIGKPVVVATQMLESMVERLMPTRAEASDVATAVASGVDCVMLSAETAVGDYPAETVAMMRRIIATTEARSGYHKSLGMPAHDRHTVFHAVAAAATRLAGDIGAVCVACFSSTGATAVRLSRERPDLPIYMITPNEETRARLAFTWGIKSIQSPHFDTFEAAMGGMSRLLLDNTGCKTNDVAVVVAGTPFGKAGTTNTIRVLTLE